MIWTRGGKGLKGWRLAAALALALLGPVLVAATEAAAANRTAADLDARGRFGGPHRATRDDDYQERQAYVYYGKDEIDALAAPEGSIQIQVARTEEIKDRDYKPLVLFEESSGDLPLEIQLSWEHPGMKGHTGVVIGGNGEGYEVWGHWVDLGRTVAVGETVTITLAWGKSPEDNRVYLDGQEATYPQARKDNFKRVVSKVSRVAVYSPLARKKLDRKEFPYNEDFDVAAVTFSDGPLAGGATPSLTEVTHDAELKAGFSGRLVAGTALSVTASGTAGAQGTFAIAHFPDLGGKVVLDWRGWGVYLEEKTIYEEGEVNLRDVTGYRVYGSAEPFDPAAPGMEPVAELKVGEQGYTFELLPVDKPWFAGVAAVMRDGSVRRVIAPIAGVALTETAPGTYTGAYRVGWQDRYPRAVVVASLGNGVETASLASVKWFAFDPSLTVAVSTEPQELRADEKSTAKVTVLVTNANGDPVPDHKMKFLLATTSQYTGVVGGGAFADQVGGSLSESRWASTDLFGKVTTTYVAGFAAKTAVIVARDMESNSTGAGYVKTYIQTTAELELEPTVSPLAAEGYEITVTSSDEWLTADGRSQARITARVTLGGQPVAGHDVDFEVSPGAGSIRVVKDQTDKNGEARAVFTAGRKIGVALITATDRTVGISGSVQIELRSDAPAKIKIQIKPEKLPADGRSRADLLVQVTDINDNPNDNVEVEYLVASGGGRLTEERTVTDRNGEAETGYIAGRSPGKVSIDITVRSTVPTDEEIAKARELALSVTDYDFY